MHFFIWGLFIFNTLIVDELAMNFKGLLVLKLECTTQIQTR